MEIEDTQPVHKHDWEPRKPSTSENDKGRLKSDLDSISVDSDQGSDQSSDDETSTFLVGSLEQLHNPPSSDSLNAETNHGLKLDLNKVSSGALAMHHLYLATMCLAYARWREVHKGSMNEVHSCNIERLCDNLNSIENRPYPASIWKIWSSIKTKQENSPLLCDVVIDSIQQDLNDSSYVYVICHAPELDLVTVVLSTKAQNHLGQSKTNYNFDSKVAVGIDRVWSDIIGEDGGLIVEILSEVKRHSFSHLSFVGHGGGGALAAICSVWACRHRLSKIVRVFSFGCPRIGDTHFKKLHNMLQEEGHLQHLRFVNEGDNFAQQPRYFLVLSKYHAVGNLVALKGRKAREVNHLEMYWERLKKWRGEMSMIEFLNQAQQSNKKPRWIRRRLLLLTGIIVAIYAPIIFLTLSHPLQYSKVSKFFHSLVLKIRKTLKVPEWETSDATNEGSAYNHASETRDKPRVLDRKEGRDDDEKGQNRMKDEVAHTEITNSNVDLDQKKERVGSQVQSSETVDMPKHDMANLDDTTQHNYQPNQIDTPAGTDQTQPNENLSPDPGTKGIDYKGRRNDEDLEVACEGDKLLSGDCVSNFNGQDTNRKNEPKGHVALNLPPTDEEKLSDENVLLDEQVEDAHNIDGKQLNDGTSMKYGEIISSNIFANPVTSVVDKDITTDRKVGIFDATNEHQNEHQEYSDSTILLNNSAELSQPPMRFSVFHSPRSFRRRSNFERTSSQDYCIKYEYSSVEVVFERWERNAWYKKNLVDKEQIEAEVSLRIGKQGL